MVRLFFNDVKGSLRDANEAVLADPKFEKGYLRKSRALRASRVALGEAGFSGEVQMISSLVAEAQSNGCVLDKKAHSPLLLEHRVIKSHQKVQTGITRAAMAKHWDARIDSRLASVEAPTKTEVAGWMFSRSSSVSLETTPAHVSTSAHVRQLPVALWGEVMRCLDWRVDKHKSDGFERPDNAKALLAFSRTSTFAHDVWISLDSHQEMLAPLVAAAAAGAVTWRSLKMVPQQVLSVVEERLMVSEPELPLDRNFKGDPMCFTSSDGGDDDFENDFGAETDNVLLVALLQRAPAITTLFLSGKLQPPAVVGIASFASNLRELELNYCEGISSLEDGWALLCRGVPNLQSLAAGRYREAVVTPLKKPMS
jgi:hypothetical protein